MLSIVAKFEKNMYLILLYLGTGDIVLDMENQVKANNVRIELLEKQNDGLRNSITKLMNMQQQQQAPQQTQWATYVTVIGPRCEKTCLRRLENNKGADQPAHPHSLISDFVIRFLEMAIAKLITSEISIFWLVSVAEETGLGLAFSETPETGFLGTQI